ncbi:MAG: glycosyltransferase family 39 protein [Denitratisoma sp.]|nr:glycosyltransferase family 39 protein [Denitratisoma sp.]
MPLPRLPFAFPPRGAVLIAFCALYLLPGLVGHDPWKGDDVTHIGVVYSMLDDGHWLLPRMAGEIWLDSPPLYHWTAALLGWLFGFILPLHDAARLASGLYAGLMILCLAGAARHFIGAEAARGAALVAIGCLGLLVHAHETQPAIAFLAATAAIYYGLALLPQRPLRGGVVAGAALGLGFLAAGLPALIMLGPLLMLLPLISSHLRTAQSARGMLTALAVAAPLILSWPLALHWQHPASLGHWWYYELAELRTASNVPQVLWNFLKLIGWFAWPALPLALWTLWKERRRLREPRTLIPLTSFLVLLAVQSVFSDPRSLNALPLLPPLMLLAAPATLSLRRGAANAFDWFGMMTFTLLAGLIWLGWLAMVTGIPAQIAKNFARLEPGFVAHFSVPAFAVSLGLTFAWLWLIFRSPRTPQRGTAHWAAGVTLCWGLLMALWLPLLDYDRSYRGAAAALKAAVPAGSNCIAGRGLGSTQRAAFHYFAGIQTLREGSRAAAQCRLFLIQGTAQKEVLPPGAGWRKIWEGGRPSDRNERFRLYARK